MLLLARLLQSTLFPYTTLFRSSLHADPWRVLRILSEFVEGFDALADMGPAITDRKSTRLNSSHVAISYAVFCLKKKIHHTHTQNYATAHNINNDDSKHITRLVT